MCNCFHFRNKFFPIDALQHISETLARFFIIRKKFQCHVNNFVKRRLVEDYRQKIFPAERDDESALTLPSVRRTILCQAGLTPPLMPISFSSVLRQLLWQPVKPNLNSIKPEVQTALPWQAVIQSLDGSSNLSSLQFALMLIALLKFSRRYSNCPCDSLASPKRHNRSQNLSNSHKFSRPSLEAWEKLLNLREFLSRQRFAVRNSRRQARYERLIPRRQVHCSWKSANFRFAQADSVEWTLDVEFIQSFYDRSIITHVIDVGVFKQNFIFGKTQKIHKQCTLAQVQRLMGFVESLENAYLWPQGIVRRVPLKNVRGLRQFSWGNFCRCRGAWSRWRSQSRVQAEVTQSANCQPRRSSLLKLFSWLSFRDFFGGASSLVTRNAFS